MRENYTDLRVVRTMESIKEAFVELIEEKGFEAITVKDITTKAKINRGTFYAHYQDKYDLMNRYQEEFMIEMSTIAKQHIAKLMTSISTNNPIKQPLDIAIFIFEFLERNRKFIKAILGPNGDLSFQTKLKNFMWKAIFENHDTPIQPGKLLVPGEYLISYIASAHIGVIQQWLLEDRKETPQEMAQILSTITFNGPFFAAGLKQ